MLGKVKQEELHEFSGGYHAYTIYTIMLLSEILKRAKIGILLATFTALHSGPERKLQYNGRRLVIFGQNVDYGEKVTADYLAI